ncbi:MAG: hypothetical protein AMXMBFR84_30010 [Candidatus Hydrogenedentota bacterium]
MLRSLLVGITCLALTALLLACPVTLPKAPFDATGAFSGTWSGSSTDSAQTVQSCALEMALTQDVNASYPQDHTVTGQVTIDYSCIQLPAWAQSQPQPSVVQVSGIMGDDGSFTLLSGGCGTGMCVALVLTGVGVDADSDGKMDTYAGNWSYRILLAGVEPFGFDGTFEVAATI